MKIFYSVIISIFPLIISLNSLPTILEFHFLKLFNSLLIQSGMFTLSSKDPVFSIDGKSLTILVDLNIVIFLLNWHKSNISYICKLLLVFLQLSFISLLFLLISFSSPVLMYFLLLIVTTSIINLKIFLLYLRALLLIQHQLLLHHRVYQFFFRR